MPEPFITLNDPQGVDLDLFDRHTYIVHVRQGRMTLCFRGRLYTKHSTGDVLFFDGTHRQSEWLRVPVKSIQNIALDPTA